MKQRAIEILDDIEFVVALKAISYCRVSTDDQADYGTSLDKQKRVNAEYAARNDIEIVETITDDFSGRKLDRPGFNQVRHYLKQGLANCLIVYDATRLSRHRTHTMLIVDELQELDCELHLSTKSKVDLRDNTAVLMLSIEGHISHNEVDKITERMTNGRRDKTREGQIMTAAPPYGYRIKKEVEETSNGRIIVLERQFEPHPEESEIVRMIFSLYATGEYSFNSLAAYLNEAGYQCQNAKRWDNANIRRILYRTAYIGKYQFSGIPIEVPQLVDQETWETAQKVIDRNRKTRRKRAKHNYLFSGRVTCWHCENAMSGNRPGNHKYYRCGAANRRLSHYYKNLCTCKKLYPEKKIQTTVFNWLHEVLTDPEVLRKGFKDYVAEMMKKHQPILDELSRVEKLIETTESKLARLLDIYLDEVIDKETYQQRKQFLEQQIESGRQTVVDLEERLSDLAKLPQQVKTVEELEVKAHKAFKNGIPEKYQQELIKELDVRIELEHTDNEMWVHITCIVGNTQQLIGASFLKDETISYRLYTRLKLE